MTCAQTYFWALDEGIRFVGVYPVAVALGVMIVEVALMTEDVGAPVDTVVFEAIAAVDVVVIVAELEDELAELAERVHRDNA